MKVKFQEAMLILSELELQDVGIRALRGTMSQLDKVYGRIALQLFVEALETTRCVGEKHPNRPFEVNPTKAVELLFGELPPKGSTPAAMDIIKKMSKHFPEGGVPTEVQAIVDWARKARK